MRILGIDPGFGGALALLMVGEEAKQGRLLCLDDMPLLPKRKGEKTQIDVSRLAALIDDALPDVVVCEWIAASPGMGASSAFRFGQQLGIVQGICAAYGLRLRLVAPSRWKHAMGVPGGDEGKRIARQKASGLWLEHSRCFARVKDDGRAEAALISLWAHLAGVAACA